MNDFKKFSFIAILYCHALYGDIGFGPGKIGYNNAVPKEFWTIKQLADGKFIVVGDYGSNNNSGSVIVRFTQEGLLDTTFGQPLGYVNDDFNTTQDDKLLDVVETTDHTLLVAGETGQDALIVKYLQNGGRDTDFWINGQISYNFVNNGIDKLWQIHELQDGNIVVCGSTSETDGEGLLAKITFNGFNVMGFNNNNHVTFANAVTFRGMVVLANGTIVVTGHERKNNTNHAVIAQFNGNGQIDGNFGANGHTNFFVGQTAESNALRKTQDGKFIVVGSYGGNAGRGFVARFTSQGALDTSFGSSSGFTGLPQAYLFWDCMIDQQERIIAVGRTTSDNNTSVGIVARFLSNGQLDTTFGINGSALCAQVVVLRGITITQDQKIIVCGDGKDNKGHVIALNADGSINSASNWNLTTYRNVNKSEGLSIGLLSAR
jgi:uncharacterized delta-60 repeat protein